MQKFLLPFGGGDPINTGNGGGGGLGGPSSFWGQKIGNKKDINLDKQTQELT